MRAVLSILFLVLISFPLMSQTLELNGKALTSEGEPLPYANVYLKGTTKGTVADNEGNFRLSVPATGEHTIVASFVGFQTVEQKIDAESNNGNIEFKLKSDSELDEVVVSGTLTEMSKLESPVPVEVFKPSFFRKNPNPSVFESMQNVNGVRPQLNCNVCNTGDIHINGLEGSYTMVLIDGMPIVSGLSTVYGLTGIPSSMIDRVEIVKGPASSLYGSEAIGGLINIITKDPLSHSRVFAEAYTTSWLENNFDVGFKASPLKGVDILTGANVFIYDNPIDQNGDNFTDVTLSKRLSVFQKWNIKRKSGRLFSFGARVYNENRWGGEMQWTPEDRGGDDVYGESIHTDRYELISAYQLPMREKLILSTSFNGHYQNSFYGTTKFIANQNIGFMQLIWNHLYGIHGITGGIAVRHTSYDDNTTVTESFNDNGVRFNDPNYTTIPGIFVQDNIRLTENQKVLLGMRYDWHSNHGNIWTPRVAYKWTLNSRNIFRINAGTGFRVVNVFTEDHAALTGAREVLIAENLDPEQSYNVNLNYIRKIFQGKENYFGLDASVWYSHFTNKIVPDYDSDPEMIIYANLDGYGVSQGATFNLDAAIKNNIKLLAGITYMDVHNVEEKNGVTTRIRPVLTENWSATWSASYDYVKARLKFDYTGNLYGPMRLPLLGKHDPRPEYSPWWSLQNIQITYSTRNGKWEFFGGFKNLLNYTPPSNSIARSHDPFDKQVEFDPSGNALPTEENPYALTFDPSYVYAPNQGIRGFAGIRFNLQ